MASFQAKTGRDWLSVIQKKKSYRFDPLQPDPKQGICKKIAKMCKKLRNIVVASFQAKTGRDRQRVIPKKKSYRSYSFQPDLEQGIAKKQQKNAKI